MRIIGGRHRGRTLISPKGPQTRPSSGQLREALFNIIDVSGMRFWDLYAGSGAVGLEALSRGAKSVLFVEQNPLALRALKSNIEVLGEQEHCRVLRASVPTGLPAEEVDIIFADPPYADDVDQLLSLLAQKRAHLFLEISEKAQPSIPAELTLVQSRRYGAAKLLELR